MPLITDLMGVVEALPDAVKAQLPSRIQGRLAGA